MELVNGYMTQLHGIRDAVKASYDALNHEQSRLDKQVSAIYHELEKVDLDVLGGYAASRQLQAVLRSRRVVKDEIAGIIRLNQKLQSFVSNADKEVQKSAAHHECWKVDFNITLSIHDILPEVSRYDRI